MQPTIRASQRHDQDAVVDLSPRAWAPVFASLEDVLGRSGHVPTRHVYERAGFTRLPIARYFKKL